MLITLNTLWLCTPTEDRLFSQGFVIQKSGKNLYVCKKETCVPLTKICLVNNLRKVLWQGTTSGQCTWGLIPPDFLPQKSTGKDEGAGCKGAMLPSDLFLVPCSLSQHLLFGSSFLRFLVPPYRCPFKWNVTWIINYLFRSSCFFSLIYQKKTQNKNIQRQASPVNWHRMTFLLCFQLPLTKVVRRKHWWSPPAEPGIK